VQHQNSRFVLAWVLIVMLLAPCSSAFAQPAAPAPPETPYELMPYRVRVAVAFEPHPLLPSAFREQVLSELSSAIDRSTGGQWTYRVEETAQIAPASALGLERIAAGDFAPPPKPQGVPVPEPEFDKQMFLTVSLKGSSYILAGREWDEVMQEVGPLAQAETYERRGVAEALFRLLSEMFEPLLRIETADVPNKRISLRLKAGGFVPEDLAQDAQAERLRVQIKPGAILLAFFRYHDQEGAVREVQFLPWTYLVVESIVRGRVEATLITGIRTPLGAKTTKRVHSLAVAKTVRHPLTTLEVRLRNNPRKKLAGHYVSATAEKYPSEDDKSPELFKLTTDRLGQLDIPVTPENPIIWLRVHSGDALLSLVPVAPGILPEVVLDLPDDSIRLKVEGDLTQIRARLVDTVARRAALMVRARKAAADKDWKTVDEEMATLDELPSLAEFRQQISDIQVSASNAAREQNSRLTERKVRELCDAANDLVTKYLSEEKLNLLKEEIKEARKGAN
jgi:hypothetical protein